MVNLFATRTIIFTLSMVPIAFYKNHSVNEGYSFLGRPTVQLQSGRHPLLERIVALTLSTTLRKHASKVVILFAVSSANFESYYIYLCCEEQVPGFSERLNEFLCLE